MAKQEADTAAQELDGKKVVGLKYEPGGALPQVVLKGSGVLAQQILRTAQRHGEPEVVKDEALLQSLYRLPIDSRIGSELFHIVALLLVHVFALDTKRKGALHD